MGLLDNLKHKRDVKRAESASYRKRELELAPETGRLKAEYHENQVRAKAKTPKKGGGILGALSSANKAGEGLGTLLLGSGKGEIGTPFSREMGGGFGAAPRKGKKRKDPYADFNGF